MNKILSGILSLVMVFSLMPSILVYAQDNDEAVEEHTHSLNLEVDDASLVGKCSEDDYSVVFATLNAEYWRYTGDSYSGANVNVNDEFQNQLSVKDIEYKLKSEDDSKYSTEAPTDCGEYVARVKITYSGNNEEYSITKDFEIGYRIDHNYGTITITKGGVYTVDSGTYTMDKHAIVIDTDEDVTLDISGHINYNPSDNNSCFIDIQKAKSVTINATQVYSYGKYVCRIKSEIAKNLINIQCDTNVILNGGVYDYQLNAINASGNDQKKITLNGCELSSQNRFSGVGVLGKNILVNSCIFSGNYHNAIKVVENGNVTFDGENESTDKNYINVSLDKNATMTLKDGFTIKDDKKIRVNTDEDPDEVGKIKITKNTSRNMVNKLLSNSSRYAFIYKDGDFYLWVHAHSWSYTAKGNVLTATCEDKDCSYHREGLSATLNAEDVGYSGNAYDKASVTNNIPNASVGAIEYYSENTKLDSAPKDVGKYTASVVITCDNQEYTLTKEFEITNPISPSSETVTITKGGDYTVLGGTYSSKTDTSWVYSPAYAIVIQTNGEDVTLNIDGDIVDKRAYGAFIRVEEGSGKVTVNAKKEDDTNWNIELNGYSGFINNGSASAIALNGGNYTGRPSVLSEKGVAKIKECVFNDETYVNASVFTIKNCTFNDEYNIFVSEEGDGILTLKGSENVFDNEKGIIHLYEKSSLTIKDDFKNKGDKKIVVSVGNLGTNVQRKVTTNTSEEMKDKIVSDKGYKILCKDGELYFWNHSHAWKYSANENQLIAKCTSEDCEYHTDGLKAILKVESGPYTGKAFKASLDSDKKAFDDAVIKYYKDDEELDEAPTEVGSYKATATIDKAVATVDFEIKNDSLSLASIFGNGKLTVVAAIVVVLAGIGFGVYKKKKK